MSKSTKNQLKKAALAKGVKAIVPKHPPVLSGQSEPLARPHATATTAIAADRRQVITTAWKQATTPEAFQWFLSDAGYVLARDDQFDTLVVIDLTGLRFNLAAQTLKVSGVEVREYLAELVPTLPNVAEAKALQKAERAKTKQAVMVKRLAVPVRGKKQRTDKSRSGSNTRRRSTPVTIRLDDEELKELEANASAASLTRASYLRQQCLATPKTRSTRRPRIEVEKVTRLLGLAGNMASNLNQIAKAANLGRTLSGNLSEALRELRELRPLFFEVLERQP